MFCIKIWFTLKNKKTSAICNLEILDHEFHNLQTHSQTFNWFHLKHSPLQHKKMSANCARQKYENYESLFHNTVSQKEALEINRFSDNSWMNWTFLYIGQEKTKVVGGRLVTVPAHKICTMAKFSKLCPKIMKAYFAL